MKYIKFILILLVLVAFCGDVEAQRMYAPGSASTTIPGTVELATDAETVTGTATDKACTPANITAKIDTDGTLNGNADTRIASQKATKTYADTKIASSEKAAASGVASLDGSSLVVQNPANATATPTGDKIPIADGSGRLTDWTPNKVKTVTSTPVTLTEAEIKHGVVLVNTGASVINLPAGSATLDGFPCVFTSIAAVSYSVDPNGSEVITKMGSDMTGGNKLTASGVAGESFKLMWDNTNSRWREYDETGVITDGGS